jgi:hypothetical protein
MTSLLSHRYNAVRWGGDLRSKWDGSVDEFSGWRTSCQCGWESEPCRSVSDADDEFRSHSGQPFPKNRISSDEVALRQAEAEGRFLSEYRRQGRDGEFQAHLLRRHVKIAASKLAAVVALPILSWVGRKRG